MRTDRMSESFDREAWAKRKNDIVDRIPVSSVVGRVVTLKKHGAEHTGLCPFHDEKTPSFTVNDRKGFYHCFGCHAHGNAIDFVIARQGLDFKGAIELLERRRRRRFASVRISTRRPRCSGSGRRAAGIPSWRAISRAGRSSVRRPTVSAIPR